MEGNPRVRRIAFAENIGLIQSKPLIRISHECGLDLGKQDMLRCLNGAKLTDRSLFVFARPANS